MNWSDYQRFRDDFAAAMDPRLYTIEYLDGLVWSGRAMFLCDDKAAIVFKLKRYPAGALVVEGVIAAGELEGVKTLIAEAEAWGRANGAAMAKIDSRSGWVRALKADGYRLHQSTLIKEL